MDEDYVKNLVSKSTQSTILIITKESCTPCNNLKKYIKEKGHEYSYNFVFVDYDKNKPTEWQYLSSVFKTTKITRVPFGIIINKRVMTAWANISVEGLQELLY